MCLNRISDLCEEVVNAVRKGNAKVVREMILRLGLDYTSEWREGYTLLRDATENGHTDIIKFLLNRKAPVNDPQGSGPTNTPLHLAVLNGDAKTVELLLRYDADISAANHDGDIPLHIAVRAQHTAIVKLFLTKYESYKNVDKNVLHYLMVNVMKYFDDVNALNNDGDSPLFIAAENGNEKIVKMLFENGANVDEKKSSTINGGYTPLHVAVEKRYENIVRILLGPRANINSVDDNGKTPLCLAIENGHQNIIKDLLECGANIKEFDIRTNETNTYLSFYKAAAFGNSEAIELLLDRYPNLVDDDGENKFTPLHWAAKNGHLDIVRVLLNKGCNPNTRCKMVRRTPLFHAVANNHIEITKLLLESNGHVNAQDIHGKTSLHYAIKYQNTSMIKLLMNLNCDVNISCKKYQRTLFQYAVEGGSMEIIKLLISCANCNVKNTDSLAPLHKAVQHEQAEIVAVLLKHGSNVDITNRCNETPLHIAAAIGNTSVAQLLIDAGANINNSDARFGTPLHYAVREKQPAMINLLLNHNADININDRIGKVPLEYIRLYNVSDTTKYTNQIIKIFIRHIVKLQSLNVPVSPNNVSILEDISPILYEKCRQKIETMKTYHIAGTRITLDDILRADQKQLTCYFRNENIIDEVKSVFETDTEFPTYFSLLNGQFHNGVKRKYLVQSSVLCMQHICGLLFDVAENIFSRLCDRDLESFLKANFVTVPDFRLDVPEEDVCERRRTMRFEMPKHERAFSY